MGSRGQRSASGKSGSVVDLRKSRKVNYGNKGEMSVDEVLDTVIAKAEKKSKSEYGYVSGITRAYDNFILHMFTDEEKASLKYLVQKTNFIDLLEKDRKKYMISQALKDAVVGF